MPPKQPKKGKGKKVTVTDPTSAPAPAPAAPPNPEVQAVLDAHIANVGSEHFPGGYFPIPYTLTSPDAESFPQPPPPREPLEAALFGKWDQPGNPHLVWRIDATRVNFALTRGVLSRFCCAVMGRYPTTLAVELKLSQVTLEAFNKTLKLCTAAASKEFVNVLDLQEMPPQGLDPEEQWLWVDPVKKSGWTHRTATDAVVRYQTVKVQAWDAVAPTEFSTNRRLRTHIPDITQPTLYSTDAPFTMLGMGCPHPSFHNSYPVANLDIPNPPIVTEEGFAAAGYRQYDRIIPEDLWARLAELATVELNPSMLEEVDLQAPGEGGGRYQTTVSGVPHWLPDDFWQAVLALLGFSLPPLQGLEALCPKIIERWEAVGYCYPTASQRDAPPRDGDPPRCGRAWPGTVHPVCTRRLPVAHADRRAGECNGADEQCSGDALRASGRGGCSRVPSVPPVWVRPVQVPALGSTTPAELQPPRPGV